MSSDLPIRMADTKDAPACAKIINDWIDQTPWMGRTDTPEAITTAIREGIPKRDFYVIGDPIEGYLSLDPAINLIGGFYTSKPGHGLGKALLDRAKAGRDYIQLWTHEPNTSARRFYAREGFKEVDRDPNRSGGGIPELRLEWHR